MFLKICLSIIIGFSSLAHGNWGEADRIIRKKMNYDSKLRSLGIELIKSKKYFSAIPWVKEYLIRGAKRIDSRYEASLTELITNVGIKQFETLPLRYLKRSDSPSIRFIMAKKYVKKQKLHAALSSLKKISSSHAIYPYAKNLEGTIYALQGQFVESNLSFQRCIESSKNKIPSSNNVNRLKLNRDYCISGIARAHFNKKDYKKSDLLYLDIPKASRVWPEILFEEAWNSYYLKNYNRSLGKLVSYNAPIFDYLFNPEVEVLKALSYMKLCLYNDAKVVSDNFYKKYLNQTRKLRVYLKRNKSNYNFFYKLMLNFEAKGESFFPLLTRLMKSVAKEQAFTDQKQALLNAIEEYNFVKSKRQSRLKSAALRNIEEVIISQKKILGSYIRSKLISHYASLYKAFEGMSYIKLETLAQIKAKLYSFKKGSGKRGDVKYIERNDKQYFWDFNGEFWADELGDYVFALKSEC